MDLPGIIYKKSPPLAFMSLNRPETRNVFTYPMMESLCKSLEILLTGRVIKMDEALRIGLVDRVVPKEELIKETENYAMEIARWSLASLRMIKRPVYNGLRSHLRGHLDYVSSQLVLLTQTEEHCKAVREFLEK